MRRRLFFTVCGVGLLLSLVVVVRYPAFQKAVARNCATMGLVRYAEVAADSGSAPEPATIRQMLQLGDAPERMFAVLAEREGHLDEAVDRYESAGRTANDPIAVYMLGEALLKNGDRDGAVAAWLRLGSRVVGEMAHGYSVRVERAVGRGEWDTVLELGTLTLALDPQMSRVHYLVGLAHSRQGSFTLAIDAYQHALEIERNPEMRGPILKALADAYVELGQTDRALQAYVQTLQESGDSIPVLAALADLYRRSGLFSESRAAYERILAIDEWYALAYLGIGDNYRDQGAYGEARAWYEDARQVDPDSGYPELALGRLSLLERRPESAIHYLLEAEHLLPADHKTVMVDLARSYRAAGHWADAVAAYRRAVDRVGDNQAFVWVWVELGRTLTELGDLEDAREVWKQVLSIDPANSEAANALSQSP